MSRNTLTSSAFLVIANVAAGILNYSFQIRAAGSLDAAQYGILNSWMAYLTLLLSFASVGQIASNFFIVGRKWIIRALLSGSLLILASFSFLWSGLSSHESTFALGAIALLLAVLFHFIMGQIQGRLLFLWMGVGVILLGFFKIAVPSLNQLGPLEGEGLFYLAFPLSYGLSALLLTLPLALHATEGGSPPSGRKLDTILPSLISSAVLAFAMNLLPQIDLLNIRFSQSDEVVGFYSRASLFSKAIYFAAVSVLQVTLPFHIRRLKNEVGPSTLTKIRQLEIATLAACALGSILMTLIAPWVAEKYLGFDLSQHRTWILLSCLNVTSLFGLLQRIQIWCALHEWKSALLSIACLIFGMLILVILKPASVTVCLLIGLVAYVALGFGPRPKL